MSDQTFQCWLNSKLQKLEITRTAFAKIAGVGYQTLHPWRLEQYDPNIKTLLLVCQGVAKLTKQPMDVVLLEAIQSTTAYKNITTEAPNE